MSAEPLFAFSIPYLTHRGWFRCRTDLSPSDINLELGPTDLLSADPNQQLGCDRTTVHSHSYSLQWEHAFRPGDEVQFITAARGRHLKVHGSTGGYHRGPIGCHPETLPPWRPCWGPPKLDSDSPSVSERPGTEGLLKPIIVIPRVERAALGITGPILNSRWALRARRKPFGKPVWIPFWPTT